MSLLRKIKLALPLSLLFSCTAMASLNTAGDIVSFMITNEGTVRGEIKIKQRIGNDSPYLIVGCNNQSDDYYILLGNLDREKYSKKSTVVATFKDRSYQEEFIPVIRDDKFYLTKSTSKDNDNQLFVYQLLRTNQAILDFGNNTVFFFNARSNSKLVDAMNVIVSHCGIKI